MYFKKSGTFKCEYCGVFVSSSKIVHAQRHVQTKGHFNKQQYYFLKQLTLKKISGQDIKFKRIEDKIDRLADMVSEQK